ncbi:protein IQ-DOMAIN 13-like [Beta vulgaris subsp. vulgaris]|uniref:protein IQ-DOMAIN 13-like n=1 Tax=Beta vulgaris subsp. vulgaris TaxID=3555 RepID=UPI002037289E|nr:protein IQ-DOMAIN 13-like [Beta vulgaris subsp. vulgaris]
MKGHSVKRQTANALKCMQMLVRIQNQIQSRRIQMLENQVLQCQAAYKNEQDLESSFSKWMSENQDQWDDSMLTKQEIEARMKRKYDAIVKRERAMAYAYSHQVLYLFGLYHKMGLSCFGELALM